MQNKLQTNIAAGYDYAIRRSYFDLQIPCAREPQVGEFSWNTWLNHPPQSSRQEAVLDKFPWTFVPVQTAQRTIPTTLTPLQCRLANKTANKGTQKISIINLDMELTKNNWYLFTKGNVLCNLTTYIRRIQFANTHDRFINYCTWGSQEQWTLWPRFLSCDTI